VRDSDVHPSPAPLMVTRQPTASRLFLPPRVCAADCLRGDFTTEEQAPDADLGRNCTYATRKAAAAAVGVLAPDPMRRFGLPSIRTDVPPRKIQSVAATADFGDGASAGSLLTPSPYAEHGIDETDFLRPRGVGELAALFAPIAPGLTAQEVAVIYDHAAATGGLTPPGMVCVEEFRRCLDAVIEARESGERGPAWFVEGLATVAGS